MSLNGQVFGRLTVTGEGVRRPSRMLFYPCRCACGKTKEIYASHLEKGMIVSCGCHRREHMAAVATTHGDSYTRPYAIWRQMHNRCYNPKSANYRRYGRRGIVVCDAWHEWLPFKEWAFKSGYQKDLTLERIDTNDDYKPENCTWATPLAQARNRCAKVLLKAWGERKMFCEWLEDDRCRVGESTLKSRLKRGWRLEAAIGTPPRARKTKP
jgi:hypothetical protein